MIFNMTGGGTSLNFKVVGGTTEPSNTKENTIWVKTEKINNWYFSATQPEGMQEWDVWFLTGTESSFEFNALKKNAVQVYPMSAKQMVGGALVDLEAMIYQGGQWIDWFVFDGYLYKAGNECVDVTGGWSQVSYPGYSNGSVSKGSSEIILGCSGNNQASVIKTNNAIDFTRFNSLTINMRKTELMGNSSCKMVVASAVNSDIQASLTISGTGKKPLPVADVEGKYYVFIYAIRPSGDFDVRFNEVTLT